MSTMIELNEQQKQICKDAVKWFKTSKEQVFEIDGLAGTGKSVLIYHILRELNLRQDQYMPMAYTGQASIVMRTKGFPNAKSIHSSLYEIVDDIDDTDTKIAETFGRVRKKKVFRKIPYLPNEIKLFFIDEGYMVPDNMVKDILSFNRKVIVCGDAHQLPPIGGRPAFLNNPYRCHHLTQLMRQAEDDPIVYLSRQIIEGNPIHNGMYGNSVMVIDDVDFLNEMIGYADVIITGTNKTRDLMNRYVREYAGIHSVFPAMFERLICRNNNWDLQQDGIALANGLNGTVVSMVEQTEFNGFTFSIDFKPDLVNTVFRDVLVDYNYFTGTFDVKQEYRNDYNKRRWMEGNMFEFAYSITTHLSQGSEYDKGIIIQEYMKPQIQRQLEYTAITRFKRSCIIVKKTGYDLQLPRFDK